MSSEVAVAVNGVSKHYKVARSIDRPDSLAKLMTSRIRHPFTRPRVDKFAALEDISFELHEGEVVGIIGRNGAGKSTLLKILTRITYPSAGSVQLHGRVGSLLEVGTGFHPELTGRENVFLNGATLGMTGAEVRSRFDDIVEFAGVERFLDTPVKRYSSGMYVRLAFAVAAHLEADILLVDEVLAVGDAEFQERCLGKMRDVAGSGRTVILVSHQLQSVRSLCDRALVLQNARLAFDGPTSEAIELHLRSYETSDANAIVPDRRAGLGGVRGRSAQPAKPNFRADEPKVLEFVFDASNYDARFYLGVHVTDQQGLEVLQLDSRLVGWWGAAGPDIPLTLRLGSPWLKPGRYRVDVFVCGPGGILDEWEAACSFSVDQMLPYAFPNTPDGTARGVVFADYSMT